MIRITDDSLQALSSSRYSNTPSNLKPLNKNKNLLKKANIKSKLQKAYASNQIIPSRNNDFWVNKTWSPVRILPKLKSSRIKIIKNKYNVKNVDLKKI